MIYNNYLKTFLDKCIALCLLLLLMPVFLIIGLLIFLDDKHSILFKQTRCGYQNNIFYIYKFRTMKILYDENNSLLPDNIRITKIGKFLRKFSLDELPELLNILKGEMSFVGPRPFIAEYLEHYNDYQKRRHNVKPGITGWAQINGRNSITWEEKFKLDIWYVENQSFILDMKIIFLTFWKVISRQDINQSNDTTMPKFTGSNNL